MLVNRNVGLKFVQCTKVYNSALLPRIRNQKTCQRVVQTSIQLTSYAVCGA